MRNRPKQLALLASSLILSGCLSVDFDPPHLVNEPRILAITVEPPEIALGEDVVVEALVVDAEGEDLTRASDVELRFMVCVSLAEVLSAAGLGAGGLEDNCDEGGDDLVRLETGGDLPPGVARLPGSALLRLTEALRGMGGMAGGANPPVDPALAQTFALIVSEVGVPLRVRLEVWRDGEPILVGYKRFAVTQRAMPTTNPPPPRFAVGEVWLSARAGEPHRCVPEAGEAPTVQAGAEVEMRPDEDDAAWLETYPAVDLEAEIVINEESAYYSWFSTGGAFSESVTQRPERDVTWTAPDEPGTYPVWLVVRDGHLGMSFCRAEVEVP